MQSRNKPRLRSLTVFICDAYLYGLRLCRGRLLSDLQRGRGLLNKTRYRHSILTADRIHFIMHFWWEECLCIFLKYKVTRILWCLLHAKMHVFTTTHHLKTKWPTSRGFSDSCGSTRWRTLKMFVHILRSILLPFCF